jgi:hypothetical protein
MSAAHLNTPALRAIAGQESASRLLDEVRQGHAPQDALFDALRVRIAAGDHEGARSFARHVQKTIERDARNAGVLVGELIKRLPN